MMDRLKEASRAANGKRGSVVVVFTFWRSFQMIGTDDDLLMSLNDKI